MSLLWFSKDNIQKKKKEKNKKYRKYYMLLYRVNKGGQVVKMGG
jgi:hypothetical protein